MPLTAINFVPKGPVKSADLNQFFNLFTGVMTDQPVTFKNVLNVGGGQPNTTVPLKVYGAIGQTTHLLDLYADPTQANPGWGIAAVGQMAWGPGGAAPTDTNLSRVATQNGHVADTAGVLISPYLEVAGNVQANLYQFPNSATLSGPTANPFRLLINQDLLVNHSLGVGVAPSATTPGGAVVSISSAGVGQSIASSALALGASSADIYKGIAGTSSAAILTTFATAQAAQNGDFVHGMYWAPSWNANGFSGLGARGISLVPQAAPVGFSTYQALYIAAPSGPAGNNYYSLWADGGGVIMGPLGVGIASTTTAQAQQHVRLVVAGTANVGPQNYGAIVQVGGNVVAGKANDAVYGEYFQPTLNANAQANITTVGMEIVPVFQGSPVNTATLALGGASGGTSTNYTLSVAAPSGPNAYAIFVAGGSISFPAQSLGGACLVNGSVGTAQLATNAAQQVQSVTAAPSGTTTSTTWTPVPEPFGATGIVVNTAAGDVVEIDVTVVVSSSAASAQAVLIGIGRDGALVQNLGPIWTQVTNYGYTGAFTYVETAPPTGSHRYTLWWALYYGTTVSWDSAIYSSMTVKLIHR